MMRLIFNENSGVPPIPFIKIFGSDSRDNFMRGRVGIGDIVNWFSKLIFLSIAVVDHFSLLLLTFRSPSFLLACVNPPLKVFGWKPEP
jgi:hypothetical protein